jgi:hypothetical protein
VNRKMLQNALAGLPPDLDQTYERILASIDEDYFQYAFRILQWVAFSIRPLTINEVAEVVAIDAKRDPAFDRDEILEDPLEVLNICSSLITFNDTHENDENKAVKRQVVELAHYSVKEYLVSDRISAGRAARYSMRDNVCHDTITASCLSYLLQFQEPQLRSDTLQSYHLAFYSATFWPRHAKKASERTKETNEAIMRITCKKGPAYLKWIPLYDHRFYELSKKNIGEIREQLYHATLFGLRDVLELLLDRGDAHNNSTCNGHALYAASWGSHKEVVKLLLDRDTAGLITVKHYRDALRIASRRGQEEVVKLLLDKGATVPAIAVHYTAALEEALIYGQEAIVKLLLDRCVVTPEQVLQASAKLKSENQDRVDLGFLRW